LRDNGLSRRLLENCDLFGSSAISVECHKSNQAEGLSDSSRWSKPGEDNRETE